MRDGNTSRGTITHDGFTVKPETQSAVWVIRVDNKFLGTTMHDVD